MPLDGKTVKGLLKDLVEYRDEKEWADRNTEKVAEKVSEEEAAELKKRQDIANEKIKKLEHNITKAVIRGFPERLGGKPERPKQKEPEVVYVPAEEPAIIEIPKTVLERINETLVAQKAQVDAYTKIAKQQLRTTEELRETLEKLKEAIVADFKERTVVNELSYPSGEATKTIPIGTTELDLWTGDVYLGDGTVDRISDSLQRLKVEYIRSVHIDVSKSYTVETDGKADYAMIANDPFVLTGISCRNISITVSEPASLKFWGSTSPNARLETAKSLVISQADELQPFDDESIRDTNAHNSLIFDYSEYTMVTFYVDNDLDQDVSAQVFGNHVNSVTKAVNIGAAFNVSAGDAVAKAITAQATGMMPYMFVRVTASSTPTTGNVNVYAICRYTS